MKTQLITDNQGKDKRFKKILKEIKNQKTIPLYTISTAQVGPKATFCTVINIFVEKDIDVFLEEIRDSK